MSDTKEIRKRHEKKEEELKKIRAVPRSQKQAEALHHNYLFGSPSHQDRGVLLEHIAELKAQVNRTCRWASRSERDEFGNRYEYVKTECGKEIQSEMCDNYCWNCGGKVVSDG